MLAGIESVESTLGLYIKCTYGESLNIGVGGMGGIVVDMGMSWDIEVDKPQICHIGNRLLFLSSS